MNLNEFTFGFPSANSNNIPQNMTIIEKDDSYSPTNEKNNFKEITKNMFSQHQDNSLPQSHSQNIKPVKKSVCNYDITNVLISENSFLNIDDIIYYGNDNLKYYIALIGDTAEKIIRQLTPSKYKGLITSNAVKEIVYWMKTFEDLKVSKKTLDQRKNYINFSNCVLDIKHMNTYNKSLHFAFTNSVNARFDDSFYITGDAFEHFMYQITNGNEYLYNRIQEIFGYIISEIRSLKVIFYFLGPKDCGKSLLLNLLTELVGKDFCSNLNLHDLNDKFRIAQLYRKKLNCCGETSEIPLSRLDLIKAISGNDYILGELKNFNAFSFVNEASLLFAGNELPKIKKLDKSNAFIDRLVIVSFSNPIPKEDQDINLLNKLLSEKDYIARWSVLGLNRLIENNYCFSSCREIDEIYSCYKSENNSVLDFIDSCCLLGSSYKIFTYQLEEAYELYCAENDIIPATEKEFHAILQGISSITRKRFRLGTDNRNGYLGIMLNEYTE